MTEKWMGDRKMKFIIGTGSYDLLSASWQTRATGGEIQSETEDLGLGSQWW